MQPIEFTHNNNLSPKRYNWSEYNHFKLLKNGKEFYPAMVDSIKKSKDYIFLETYFVESGQVTHQFIQALKQAADRGVKVFILLDAVGARGLRARDISNLQNGNIQLCFYHPFKFLKLAQYLTRDHRKLLFVDGKIAFIGGAGLSDQFIGAYSWKDNMVAIQGDVLSDWYHLFKTNWQKVSKLNLPAFNEENSNNSNFKAFGRISYTHGPLFNQISKGILTRINNCQKTVWLVSPYFLPSFILRKKLRKAALAGMDVRIVLPGNVTDNKLSKSISEGYYEKLLKCGVRIFEYQKTFIHSKLVIVDNWISMGSSNMDTWGGYWNLEANQEIIDPAFLKQVEVSMQQDFLACQEIFYNQWKKRPLVRKIKNFFWKKLYKLFEHLERNRPQKNIIHQSPIDSNE